jgi:hypothetical protein
LLVTAGLLCLLLGTGCAGIGTVRSQVVDAKTGQPVQGAVVLGVWTKQVGLLGMYRTELVGVKEVEVDTAGRFELERPGDLSVDEEKITVYKFGYVAWSNQLIFPSFKRREDTQVPERIRLEAFPANGDHRPHMRFIDLSTSSSLSAGSWNKFQQAIRQEERMR